MLAIAAEFHETSKRNTASDFFCGRNDPLRNVIRVPANTTLQIKTFDNNVRYVLLGNTVVTVDPWGTNFQTALYAQVACVVTLSSFVGGQVTATLVTLDSPCSSVIRNPNSEQITMPAGGILHINVSEQIMNVIGNGKIALAETTATGEFVLDLSVSNKIVPLDFAGLTTATIDLSTISTIDENVRDWTLLVVDAGTSDSSYKTNVSFTHSGTNTSPVFLTVTQVSGLVRQVKNPTGSNTISVMSGTHIFVTKLANQLYINSIVESSV